MSCSLSLLVGFSIQDETMDVTRSAPQGGSLLPCGRYLLGIMKGWRALWYSEVDLHQLGSRPTVFIPRWTTHPCILYQVCATRGAVCCCCFVLWMAKKVLFSLAQHRKASPNGRSPQKKSKKKIQFVTRRRRVCTFFRAFQRPRHSADQSARFPQPPNQKPAST